MKYLQYEREGDVETALVLAREYCERKSLNISLTDYGVNLKTSLCTLTDSSGALHVGKGKGLYSQSIASALFEAIEHYEYETDRLQRLSEYNSKFISKSDVTFYDCCPRFELFPGVESTPLTRVTLNSLNNNTILDYPAFLTHPKFKSKNEAENVFLNRTRLRRYSSNSGTASGVSKNEAILHGLMELIERDALSTLLLRTIFKANPDPVQLIQKDTLPPHLKDLCKMSEVETAATLKLYFMMNDIGIPAILAELKQHTPPCEIYFGSGASIVAEYAIERAVLEAVQGAHIFSFELKRAPKAQELSNQRKTKYQKCLLEYGIFDYRGGAVSICAQNVLKNDHRHIGSNLDNQIDYALRRLTFAGIYVYSRPIYNGILSVEQVVAPLLERFFLVSTGIIIAPGRRGASAIYHN